MNGIDLAPCPFCGDLKATLYFKYPTTVFVQCTNDDCLAEGPVSADDVDAVKAWNNRKVKP